MNTRILAVLGIGTVLLAVGTAIAAERTVMLAVDNMYCSACPYTVKQSLAKVTGVDEAVVSCEKKTATVTYDDEKTTVAALSAATAQAGYPSHAIDAAAAAR